MRPAGSGTSRLPKAAKLETCASEYHHVAEKKGGDVRSGSQSRSAANYSGAKASSTLPGIPFPVPTYPDPTYNVPSTTTEPGAPSDPPFPATPLTVANGCAVL